MRAELAEATERIRKAPKSCTGSRLRNGLAETLTELTAARSEKLTVVRRGGKQRLEMCEGANVEMWR